MDKSSGTNVHIQRTPAQTKIKLHFPSLSSRPTYNVENHSTYNSV